MGLTRQVHCVQFFLSCCQEAFVKYYFAEFVFKSQLNNKKSTIQQFGPQRRGRGAVNPLIRQLYFTKKYVLLVLKHFLYIGPLVVQSGPFTAFWCENTIFWPCIYKYIPYSLPCHVCPVGRMSFLQPPDETCCSCWSRKYFCPIIDQLRYSYLPLRLCNFKTCFDSQRHKGWFALRARRNQLQNLIRVVTVVGCSCSKAMGNAMTGNTGR